MSESFSDIRHAVQGALAAVDDDKGADLCVSDLGPDWVVYSDPDTDGGGLFRRGYELTGGNVKFTSDPVKVTRQTTYSEQSDPAGEPKTLKEAGVRVREHFRTRRAARDR